MGREENAAIFQDTEKLCKSIDELKNAIRKSKEKQRLILETDKLLENFAKEGIQEKRYEEKGVGLCNHYEYGFGADGMWESKDSCGYSGSRIFGYDSGSVRRRRTANR